jgi:hypothetical protein
VHVTCSYVPEVAAIQREEELVIAVRDFVDRQLEWIRREFPEAMNNPAMADVYFRLGRPFPEQGDA